MQSWAIVCDEAPTGLFKLTMLPMVAFLAGSLAPVSRTGLVLIRLDMTAWLTGVPCTIEGALLNVIFVFTF